MISIWNSHFIELVRKHDHFMFFWYIFNVRRTQIPTLRTHTGSVGCHKHFCFKPLAHRSVKLTFSRRSIEAVVRSFFSVALWWHTRCHDRMSIWWSLDAKNTWFQAYDCYKSVKFTFSPTPPSQKALLRSPCQAVTMTTSENVILYDLRTHWNHHTKVPRGVQPTP